MIKKIHRLLFYVLVFLLPINLGKHFDVKEAYVSGSLVDYLIPTLYVQDILAGGLLLFWLISLISTREQKKNNILSILNRPELQVIIFLAFSILLSVLSSVRVLPSFYIYIRFLLYIGALLYCYFEFRMETETSLFIKTIALSTFLVSVLGIFQFINQKSVFNNYLFLGLGEQPYTFSTWGVDKENFMGHTTVPAYGLFRHPNIFAGFLVVALSLMLFNLNLKESKILLIPIIFAFIALFCTLSLSAYFAFIFGLISVLVLRKNNDNNEKIKSLLLIGAITIISVMTFAPMFFKNSDNPSLYRRNGLLISSLNLIKNKPLFGVGFNNITVSLDSATATFRQNRFNQPVHNIFVLLLAESGIFAFFFFIILLFFALDRQLSLRNSGMFLVILLQIMMLGSTDHYFLTIHQTFLLFLIVLGLSLKRV